MAFQFLHKICIASTTMACSFAWADLSLTDAISAATVMSTLYPDVITDLLHTATAALLMLQVST